MLTYMLHSKLQGSKDNMSVVLVVFSGAPKVSPEAQQKDLQLNQILEKKVKGKVEFCSLTAITNCFFFLEILTNNHDLTINGLFQSLSVEDIDGLPPGAGIEAK